MANLSITTINKFLRETYSVETKAFVKAGKKAQVLLLKEFAEQVSEIADLHSDGIDKRWIDGKYKEVPEITISVLALLDSNRYRDDSGSFSIGFKDNRLMIWKVTWGSRSPKVTCPLKSLDEVDLVIKKIRDRIKENKLKIKKKNATEGFTTQNLKSRLLSLAKKRSFEFSVANRDRMFIIYIKDGKKGPVRIKIDKGDTFETELSRLGEYLDHALEHLEFCQTVSIPKEPSHHYASLAWHQVKQKD